MSHVVVVPMGLHAVAMDGLTGCGLLALPNPAGDVLDPMADSPWLAGSAFTFDLSRAAAECERRGWDLPEDLFDPSEQDPPLPSGHRVVACTARVAVVDEPTLSQVVEAVAECRAALISHVGND